MGDNCEYLSFLYFYAVLGLTDSLRFETKVTSPICDTYGFPKCNPWYITQLLLVSVQCLWIYDYLLTLEDEVL